MRPLIVFGCGLFSMLLALALAVVSPHSAGHSYGASIDVVDILPVNGWAGDVLESDMNKPDLAATAVEVASIEDPENASAVFIQAICVRPLAPSVFPSDRPPNLT